MLAGPIGHSASRLEALPEVPAAGLPALETPIPSPPLDPRQRWCEGPPRGAKGAFPPLKILVAGSTGFVGRHVSEHLVAEGASVWGWGRTWTHRPPGPRDATVDLLAAGELPQPPPGGFDGALVLAAESRPAKVDKEGGAERNVAMVRRVLEHLAERSPGARTLVTSSGHVYAPSDAPLTEASPLRPSSPYAASKLLTEACAQEFTDRLQIVVVRPFNQIGPGMAPGLLLPDLLERLVHTSGPLAMRGQDATRDFLDIRDACRAYSVLLRTELPSGSLFNLGSGRPTRVSELVRALLEALGQEREVTFAEAGTSRLVGSPQRLQSATGWQPELSLEETASMLARWIRAAPTG